MTEVLIELPGTPVGKGRPRFVRSTGHAYTPDRTRTYEMALKLAGMDAMKGRAMFEGPLRVSIIAVMPVMSSWTKRKQTAALAGTIRPTTKPDPDNILKLLDALNEVVWKDDSQIVDARVRKQYGAEPLLSVMVEPA